MNRNLRLRLLAATMLVLVGLGAELPACQICLPFPAVTLADRILSSEHVRLVREDPETPFSLLTVRTLKSATTKTPPLDLFLDSVTRRQLAHDPELSLLCGWSSEADGWRQLELHDETLAPVVEDVIGNAERWRDHPHERVRYFADLLNHEDSTLSDLAHLEVARAPYRDLLQYANRIPREALHEELENHRRTEWHALYILFLSRSENPLDQKFIRRELEHTAEYGLATQSAAWATALIEIDGAAGIERLRELYLLHPGRRPEEIAAVHAALRVHGNEGRPELRTSIVESYRELLPRHPEIAATLVEDLSRWQRHDLAPQVAELLRVSDPDPPTSARLRAYLLEADAPSASTVPPPTGVPLLPVLLTLFALPVLLAFFGQRSTPVQAVRGSRAM